MTTRVSLAELIDADVPLRPDEAVAIVREVCRQHADGELRGIPNATVIRLTQRGRIVVEGPVSRDQDPIRAAATLLSDLLPGFHTPSGFKVPGGLRLVLARAARTLDLPPFADVVELCAALERFAAADVRETVHRLFEAWARQSAAPPPPLPGEPTISDVRRARRTTGLSLEDIARASGISAWKLRELEWGYLRNWYACDESREDLRRYARAAGLDDGFVVSVAWPMIEDAARSRDDVEAAAPLDADTTDGEPWALVPVPPAEPPAPLTWPAGKPHPVLARYRWRLALAAAILLVVTAMALGWERNVASGATVPEQASAATHAVLPPGETLPVAAASESPAPAAAAPMTGDARHASYSKPSAAHPRASKAKPRPAPERKSFFKRELFRIVIK